ncbi:Kv channel-interacting protein 4-like isoform X4 [Penaeus vannamei]|uniref:Kv channel-interacting protein 4-like isoform X4 n=1 Tax=Penaeus vannamei TaxID=6689 RepID=UPI00387F7227
MTWTTSACTCSATARRNWTSSPRRPSSPGRKSNSSTEDSSRSARRDLSTRKALRGFFPNFSLLEDFLAALSTVSRGTTQEKLQWIFGLYDVNNDGLITKTEMVDVVTAIYEMMGRSTEPQVEETSAKEHVEKIFHLIDTNQDGAITIEELAEWVSRDDTIIQSLSMMDTVLFTRRDRGADGAPPPTRPSLSQP